MAQRSIEETFRAVAVRPRTGQSSSALPKIEATVSGTSVSAASGSVGSAGVAGNGVSAPPGSAGAPAIEGATLSPALNEAAQEIVRLREAYQRQADLITANT